ncbi:capping protein, Arp2/3 and myosin-I linker protein 2 isoform X2 [Erpetoichthys calabaricus]|uniref:capping protein, Arp2/3 and myosin-I linker protein 2 isoform X2 n=1 Tax=Erpetoichthys calabaricus TaxID=27687 RepID=UPI002233F9AD|nr:capping protein, Arp2/3 and myosin-I linker protein 2 isoform X2 [Erpetoichthys calabaricus]
MATGAKQEISFGLQDSIIRFLKPQKVKFMKKIQLHHSKTTSEERILVVTLWRAHIVYPWLPVKVESSFSYLEVYGITVTDPRQVIIETDRFALSLSLMSLEDLEQVVGHVTSSLKKIFPDSSPGKLLKNSLPDMQERLKSIACSAEGALDTNQGPCGGFSETYAALCDYNEFSCREEIQWDVDNIYHSQENREFNLLDFSHMESRDVALAVAALSFNQWFTKIYCKDFKLSSEVLEQVLYMINRSPKLEEVSLENCGLKMDFALKMAQALREHTCSALHMVTIAGNQIEDRGAAALCQEFENLTSGLAHISFSRCNLSPKGLNALGQALTTNKSFSNSLRYLDLSGNPGLLSTEEANDLFLFLSCSNILTHLDLSATDCPLPPLFVALSVGCCSKLSYLNVSRNIYSHKKARDIPESLKDFFCGCKELKFMGFSGTKIPSEALRILLQSLASNSYLSDLELDLSYCELRSPGAQVIQDHIFEANAIGRLDLSDNGFDSDMVTLVLSIGRSQSIRHLSLGKNFGMKSKALADVLHRIVQLIQEEECPLESLSVAESRLKTGTNVLITALGSNNSLTKIDISGNYMGDMGAKMLAKALQVNTTLGTVIWDRNNTSAAGFLDVAHALERNYTLKCMPIPINDVSQAYRNNPEKTEEAVQKIQAWLQRNNQRQTAVSERAFRLQQGIMTSTSEQLVKRMCAKLEDKVKPLQSFSVKEVQEDILLAEEVLCNARASMTLLPSLYEMGRLTPSAGIVHCRLKKLIDEISQAVRSEMQVLVQTMLDTAEKACPKILHRTKVRERLATYVSKKIVQSEKFVKEAIFQQLGEDVTNKLSELKLSTTVTIAENIIDEMLQDLSASQNKLAQHLLDQTQIVTTRTGEESLLKRNKALFELAETEFPMDEYVPVIRRQTLHTRSIRPTPVIQMSTNLHPLLLPLFLYVLYCFCSFPIFLYMLYFHSFSVHTFHILFLINFALSILYPLHIIFLLLLSLSLSFSLSLSSSLCVICILHAFISSLFIYTFNTLSLPYFSVLLHTSALSFKFFLILSLVPFHFSITSLHNVYMVPFLFYSGSLLSCYSFPLTLKLPLCLHLLCLFAYLFCCSFFKTHIMLFSLCAFIFPFLLPPYSLLASFNLHLCICLYPPNVILHSLSLPVFPTLHLSPPFSLSLFLSLPPDQGELDADSQQEDTKGSGGSDQLSVSRPLTKSRPASSEDAALSNSLPPSSEPASPQRLMDLPIEGQRLQHYTRARPRPNRRNKQPPSKPNVQATSCENEENEKYGKVDEGVDDFFAKKLIPEDPLKFLQPVKVQDPVCSTPPSGTRTIKKKFGDFFAFKKPRSSRGQKGEGAPESSPSGGLRLKKTSIADLIRPLREAARAAEKAEESAAKVSTIASTTGPTAVTGTTTTTTATTTTTPTTTTESPAGQLPIRVDREKSKTLESDREKSKTPDAERKLKPSRRSLREGKSQSLILLTGVDEEESLAASHGKKLSEKGSAEGPQTFEQKVHIMLHRIGVTKVLSSDTKKNQNKDGELRKADSEGTIVDSKPQPPPQFITPRTMSTSSDMRRPFRAGHVTEPLRGMDKSCQERTSPALPKAPVKPPVSEIQEHSLEVSPATRMPKPLQEQSPVDSCLTEEGGSLSKCKKETLTPTPSPRRMTGVTEKEKSERAMPVASEGDNKSEVSIKRCSPENQTASGEVLQTAAKAQQVPQTAQRSLRDQRTDPPVSLKNMN